MECLNQLVIIYAEPWWSHLLAAKSFVPISTTVLSGKFTEVGPCAFAFQCRSREHWIRSMCLFTHLSDELNEQYRLCQSSTFYNCSLGQQSFQIGLYQFVILLATFPPYCMFLVSADAFTYCSGLILFKVSKCIMCIFVVACPTWCQFFSNLLHLAHIV